MLWLAGTVFAAPLAAFLLLLPLGRQLGKVAGWLGSAALCTSFACAVVLFYQFLGGARPQAVEITWLYLPDTFALTLGIAIDYTAALMLVVVTLVALLVHLFSMVYMAGERNYVRYYTFLSLFAAAMIGLVLADSLMQLFICWELVGFSSYLLIGFWFEKPEAAHAASKAFWLNRIADAGLLAGLLLLLAAYQSLSLSYILAHPEVVLKSPHATAIGLLLFLGAVGKSAQFPLQVWLPDAMAGPTPVSALIHAATMVAAGVYLLVRVFPLFNASVLIVIAWIGLATVLIGAFCALRQWDIKRVLAFSTISQLGYMVLAVGLGAPHLALFHLVTHAFFKAALFLSAGSIIHSLHHAAHTGTSNHHFDVQDMRLLGGLRQKLPVTFVTYLVAGSALIGLPLTTGFISKDDILAVVLARSPVMGWLALLGVVLTAFYVFRQGWLVFAGASRLPAGVESNIHEAGWLIKAPLVVLGALSLFFWVGPLDELASLAPAGFTPYEAFEGWLLTAIVVGLALVGMGAAYLTLRRPAFLGRFPSGMLGRLSEHQLYLNELYSLVFVRPFLALTRGLVLLEKALLDGAIQAITGLLIRFRPVATDFSLVAIADRIDRNGIDRLVHYLSARVLAIGSGARRLQSGQLQKYLIYTLVGMALALILLFLLN